MYYFLSFEVPRYHFRFQQGHTNSSDLVWHNILVSSYQLEIRTGSRVFYIWIHIKKSAKFPLTKMVVVPPCLQVRQVEKGIFQAISFSLLFLVCLVLLLLFFGSRSNFNSCHRNGGKTRFWAPNQESMEKFWESNQFFSYMLKFWENLWENFRKN